MNQSSNDRVLLDFIKSKSSIHMFGDTMCDQYVNVKVNRLSPEFPTVVMTATEECSVSRPGGVANVASTLSNFKFDLQVKALMDNRLIDLLESSKIGFHKLNESNVQIPVKRRFFDNDYQVTRFDIEQTRYGMNSDDAKRFFEKRDHEFQKSLNECDAIILSDYNKGFFDRFELQNFEIPKKTLVVVDPKTNPISRWKGCTVFKPNRKEAKELSGFNYWQDQAKYFKDELNCEHVVITHEGKRICGLNGNDFFEYEYKAQNNPISVIGAGDCFVAFLTAAYLTSGDLKTACGLAWRSGNSYVQNKHNYQLFPSDLVQSKITSPELLRDRNFKLIVTNGCFDILHKGHLELLRFCKSQGDRLLVAVNSDESIKRLKGESRPVKRLDERLDILSELECVDFLIPFGDNTPSDLYRIVQPDLLVKGTDWEGQYVAGQEYCGDLKFFKNIENYSTTSTIHRMSIIEGEKE